MDSRKWHEGARSVGPDGFEEEEKCKHLKAGGLG